MQETGFNNAALKQQNRGLALRLAATGECSSRIEIARRTGLSKMAASNIIAGYIEEDILEESESIKISGKGRNPIQLKLSDKAPKLIGVYIAKDECRVILCDMHLKILAKAGFQITQENHSRFVKLVCRCIDRILKKASEQRIWGIGIASSGSINYADGTLLHLPGFPDTEKIPIVDILKEKYGMPVFLSSQYNTAALAEKYYGNAQDCQDFVYLGISDRIGAGLIYGNALKHDLSGRSSAFGHISIGQNGRICSCGRRGCVAAYASVPVICSEYREETGQDLSFRDICKASEKGDTAAVSLLNEMTDSLTCALTNVSNLVLPEKVILGSEGCFLPDNYLQRIEDNLNRYSCTESHIRVLKSAFGHNSGLRGSAAGLLMRIFEGEFF